MAKQIPARIGGSFAPPLTDEILSSYQNLINAVPSGELREALDTVMTCVRQWWALPESTNGSSKPHPSQTGTIIDLDDHIKTALDSYIPWEKEIQGIQDLFEEINPNSEKDLRNAAFHLLWFVRELNLDREPITLDKV